MPLSRRRNGRDAVVAEMRRRGAVVLGGQPIRVRNAKGNPIPCVLGDCTRDGDHKWRIEKRNAEAESKHMPGGKIIRIFCSERHRDMWIAKERSIRRYGPLAG